MLVPSTPRWDMSASAVSMMCWRWETAARSCVRADDEVVTGPIVGSEGARRRARTSSPWSEPATARGSTVGGPGCHPLRRPLPLGVARGGAVHRPPVASARAFRRTEHQDALLGGREQARRRVVPGRRGAQTARGWIVTLEDT